MTLFEGNRPLLDAYRKGERSALEAVYRRYAPRVIDVLRFGFRFESHGRTLRFRGFSDSLELESAVQEVFLRAFGESARLRYDGLRPFEPYLLRIAKNRIIDEFRRRRTALERLVGPLDDPESVPADELPADDRLHAEHGKRLVREFVGGRDELERRYIAARFVADRSLLGAARELGITRMRARVLERRILKDLERELRRTGYLERNQTAVTLAMLMV